MSVSMHMPPDLEDPHRSGHERRLRPRMPYRSEIHWGVESLEAAQSVDLSVGGVGFISTLLPTMGAEVEVAFLERSVAVRGIVRNQRPVEGGYRVGVQFHAEEREVVEVVLGYS